MQPTNHTTASIPAKSTQRIEFIDLAKGVCIILVVLLHSGVKVNSDWISLGHLRMPLYFFLSGIFFKDYGGYIKTFLKKADKLLIPFTTFLIIGIIVNLASDYATGKQITPIQETFIEGKLTVSKPLWFLLCLFWQSMLFLTISRHLSANTWRTIAVVATAGLGILLSTYNLYLPLYLDSAMTFLPFYYIGYICKQLPILTPNRFDKYSPLVIIILMATATLIFQINHHTWVEYINNTYQGSIILHYTQSLCMILSLILLCKMIVRLPLISYLGRFSIIILLTHTLVITILNALNRHILPHIIHNQSTDISSTIPADSAIDIATSISTGPAIDIATSIESNALTDLSTGIPNWGIFILALTICALLIRPLRTHLPHLTAQSPLLSPHP